MSPSKENFRKVPHEAPFKRSQVENNGTGKTIVDWGQNRMNPVPPLKRNRSDSGGGKKKNRCEKKLQRGGGEHEKELIGKKVFRQVKPHKTPRPGRQTWEKKKMWVGVRKEIGLKAKGSLAKSVHPPPVKFEEMSKI